MALFGAVLNVIFLILYIFNLLFAVLVIFLEKRSPVATWAWLFVIFALPYGGFVIYLLFGLDSRKHRRFGEKAANDIRLFEGFIEKYAKKAAALSENAARFEPLAALNVSAGGSDITANNDITPFYTGADKFAALGADIKAAASYVHLQYYILRNDETGKRLIELLAETAGRGVEVRLSIDGMGCFFTPKTFYEPLRAAGGHVATFWPPRFLRHNFRNHRKVGVIDGNIGYIGGFNVGDEYLSKSKRFGNWRDTAIRISGGAARDLELRFIMDWNYCGTGIIELSEKYFPPVLLREPRSRIPMQIIASGPDTQWNSIYLSYGKIITLATRNIYIQTPYFVPDGGLLESLRTAALAGVDVRVMIPEKPDHMFVHWASLSYLGELLSAGVRVYQYTNGFLHAKTVMIDGAAAHVGTANMDERSFKLNFEISACIFDTALCAALESKFLRDLDDCREMTAKEYADRGRGVKIKEAVSRLLSPLL